MWGDVLQVFGLAECLMCWLTRREMFCGVLKLFSVYVSVSSAVARVMVFCLQS